MFSFYFLKLFAIYTKASTFPESMKKNLKIPISVQKIIHKQTNMINIKERKKLYQKRKNIKSLYIEIFKKIPLVFNNLFNLI